MRARTMAGDTICYLNTDLELTSARDLTALAAAFKAGGMFSLHVALVEEGLWHTALETDAQYDEPEPNIAAMLAAIEALPQPMQTQWSGCTRREFNIGYDCGSAPQAFDQGLSSALLARIAAAGASLRITLYAPEKAAATREG